MKRLKCLNEYLNMMEQLKQKGRSFVNDILLIDEVKRYLRLNRIWHITSEAGVIFLLDEETYYKAVLCVDPDQPWVIENLNKPVVIRVIYRKEKKKESVVRLEQTIKKNGFEFQHTQVRMKVDISEHKEKALKKFNKEKKLLEKFHYKIGSATIKQYDQIQELADQEDIMKYYHEPYRTKEEIKQRFDRHEYVCISDANDNVLVYGSGYSLNGYHYGDGIVVREEYKMSGLAPILMHYTTSKAEYEVLTGSVALDNESSIKLHKRMGWKITDKCIDYWLLK